MDLPLEAAVIEQLLPHRYPFLLVDRIVELVPGEEAVGIKNVTRNEPYFDGHFPGNPVMPGVLIVEALAQTAAACILSSEEYRGKFGLFGGIDGFRFREPVRPGDRLRLQVEITRLRGPVGRAAAAAAVDDATVADGELTFAMVDDTE